MIRQAQGYQAGEERRCSRLIPREGVSAESVVRGREVVRALLNLSQRGVCLALVDELRPGQSLFVNLYLTGRAGFLAVPATILWAQSVGAQWVAGLQFLAPIFREDLALLAQKESDQVTAFCSTTTRRNMSPPDPVPPLPTADPPALQTSQPDGPGLPLSAFAAGDQALIRLAYEVVKGVCDLWLSMCDAPDLPRFRGAIIALDSPALINKLQKLGGATAALGAATPRVRAICHDICGGGLSGLLGMAGLLRMGAAPPGALGDCFLQARDHAELMRKVVTDLDPHHPSPELPLHQPAALSGKVDQLY